MIAEHHLGFLLEVLHLHFVSFFCIEIVILFCFSTHTRCNLYPNR